MSDDLHKLDINLSICSQILKSLKNHIDELKVIHTNIENYYHIVSSCNECNTVIDINPNNYNKIYLDYCDNTCNCDTEYCQIEYIYNREGKIHDRMLFLREIIKYELEIKNNSLKILNLFLNDENKYKYFKYCSKCYNVQNVINV